jgi:hypothetical protein
MSSVQGNPFEEDLHLRPMLDAEQESGRAMLEAEDALQVVRERFELTEDPEVRGELAASALEQVDRQMELTRERRQNLDGFEGRLWTRRNRLEGFLIQARGTAWWHAHGRQF